MYNFNKEKFSNNLTEQALFLIDQGTNVIIQVRDSGLKALQGYTVEIERFHPGLDKWELIKSGETDVYGQVVARLIENTVKYRFIIRDLDNNIVKETGDMTIACRAAICVLPFVVEEEEGFLEQFEEEEDTDWTLKFDKDTNIYTFSWTDISGKDLTYRLFVERLLWNETTKVCNKTSTTTFGSLTCNVGSTNASYMAKVYRTIPGSAPKETKLGMLAAKVGDIFDVFGYKGKEGLLWSFILLMTMITIGYWYPPAGVGLYLFGVIILGTIGILHVSPTILVAQMVIGIIFIWAFRG